MSHTDVFYILNIVVLTNVGHDREAAPKIFDSPVSHRFKKILFFLDMA